MQKDNVVEEYVRVTRGDTMTEAESDGCARNGGRRKITKNTMYNNISSR
jgi:hypothetical protein